MDLIMTTYMYAHTHLNLKSFKVKISIYTLGYKYGILTFSESKLSLTLETRMHNCEPQSQKSFPKLYYFTPISDSKFFSDG